MSRSIRIFTLGGLLLANLALTWLLWRQYGPSMVRYSALAVPVCQAELLAVWLALGAGKWHWRLAVVVPLALLLGQAMTLGAKGQPMRVRSDAAEVTTFLGLGLIELLLVVFALLLPLGQLRGWRLTCDPAAEAAPTAQFRIRDILVWMIPLGVALGLPRGLASVGYTPLMELAVVTLVIGLGVAPVVWPAILTSFATKHRGQKLAGLTVWTLLYGSLLAAVSLYPLYRTLQAVRPGLWVPWWRWLYEFAAPLLVFVAAAVLTAANCLALRALGMRLVRPARQPAAHDSPPTTHSLDPLTSPPPP